MLSNEFRKICQLAQEGREEMVNHPGSHEDGQVLACDGDTLIVRTEDGRQARWSFEECHEIHQHRDDFRYN